MPTIPVLCLLCLYYVYYACTMPTMPTMLVLCLLCLYYAYYACTMPTMPICNYRIKLQELVEFDNRHNENKTAFQKQVYSFFFRQTSTIKTMLHLVWRFEESKHEEQRLYCQFVISSTHNLKIQICYFDCQNNLLQICERPQSRINSIL